MKNKALLFILLIWSSSSFSQSCFLSLDELYSLDNLDEFDLETNLFERGFSYDSNQKSYVCDEKYGAAHFDLLNEPYGTLNISVVGIIYVFFDKTHYLKLKKSIPKEDFIEVKEDEELGRSLIFNYRGRTLILRTKTTDKSSVSAYIIVLPNESE